MLLLRLLEFSEWLLSSNRCLAARCVSCIDPQRYHALRNGNEWFLPRLHPLHGSGGAGIGRKGCRSLVPSRHLLSHLSRCSATGVRGKKGFCFPTKYRPCLSCLLCPHLPLPPSSLPDAAPWFLHRLRRGARLLGSRNLPWISLRVSEGSRCESGWLACIVSTLPGPYLASRNVFYPCSERTLTPVIYRGAFVLSLMMWCH